MPWPFDDKDSFSDLIKDFEDFHHFNQNTQRHGFLNTVPQTQINPRAYFLHDPRHLNERKAPGNNALDVSNPIYDSEMNVNGNFKKLLEFDGNNSDEHPIAKNINTHESVSSSWIIKNGKMCKQQRREKVVGRTRTVSVTSTDENGNITTHEYSENL